MKKIKITLLAILLPAALGVLSGCRSDGYYQDQAVISAREFLLEEKPSIPLMDQEFIKFNRPFMLVEPISGSTTTGRAQICICWMTPDNPEVYMVYGISNLRMIDWAPQRIITKSFRKTTQHEYLRLAGKASGELIQMQFGLLSVASVNNIRFTLPGVWKCNFALDSNPDTKYTPEELEKASRLPRYVLAWKITENGRIFYSVYGGTAENDDLKNFKCYFSGIYSEENFLAGLPEKKPLIAPFGGAGK